MKALETRIPPLVLVLIFAAAMFALARVLPTFGFVVPARLPLAVAVASAGVLAAMLGVLSFRRARTTVNPLQPEAASSLVAVGIYRVSRNPMYLGFLMLLAGWALWLANAAAFALLPLFVLYMNAYQIVPEERALAARFGSAFSDYCRSVRRWL